MNVFSANGCDFISENDMIGAHIKRTGEDFEPVSTQWALEKDGLFIDVGASTGWFSIPIAKSGCKVVAIEPNPNVVPRLKENASLNGVSFEIRQAAASDENGKCTLYFNATLPLTSGASLRLDQCLAPTGRTNVDTITIDSLCLKPKLIKIDVEGHEISVLKGAERTITDARPYMMLEANTPAHEAVLAEWLAAHDYTYEIADVRNMLCSPKS